MTYNSITLLNSYAYFQLTSILKNPPRRTRAETQAHTTAKKINPVGLIPTGIFLVRVTGIEPARRKALDPKSSASASSATLAHYDDTIQCVLLYSTSNC